MEKLRAFLKRKNIEISAKRYGIDALGAMAQGLFCSLLIGTIVKTLGQQLGMEFLIEVGGYASAMSGAAMAVAIGYALKAPPLVLFSLVTVGYDLLRRHLRRFWPDRAGWRRGGRRLLRQHGGLRRPVLPGEPLERPDLPGAGHLHAPDGQHRPQSPDLAPRHPRLRGHRPPGHLCVPV